MWFMCVSMGETCVRVCVCVHVLSFVLVCMFAPVRVHACLPAVLCVCACVCALLEWRQCY